MDDEITLHCDTRIFFSLGSRWVSVVRSGWSFCFGCGRRALFTSTVEEHLYPLPRVLQSVVWIVTERFKESLAYSATVYFYTSIFLNTSG